MIDKEEIINEMCLEFIGLLKEKPMENALRTLLTRNILEISNEREITREVLNRGFNKGYKNHMKEVSVAQLGKYISEEKLEFSQTEITERGNERTVDRVFILDRRYRYDQISKS